MALDWLPAHFVALALAAVLLQSRSSAIYKDGWIDFNKNGVSAAMLFSVCIEYQTPFGDIKTCQIFPNANPCVDPGGAPCQ